METQTIVEQTELNQTELVQPSFKILAAQGITDHFHAV